MAGGTPGGPAPASRAARHARRRHAREAIVVLVLVAIVGGGWWVVFGRSSDACCPVQASSPPGPGPGLSGGPHLLALSISGGADPHLAVIGVAADGTNPAAVPIPDDLSIVVPGQGETPALDVAALPGASMQVALSNVVGTWVQDYAVLDIAQLSALADRMGGITVDLAAPQATTAGVLGPGKVKLRGFELAGLFSMQGGDTDERWRDVLSGLLAAGPTLRRADLTSVSSVGGVQQVLGATTGAQIVPVPTSTVVGALAIAKQPEFDALLTSTWHTTAPTPVIVQNGSGAPGVGEAVARLIIPAGFRVVLSQNAVSFDVATTDIIANGKSFVDQAREVRKAMKVGLVERSQISSGIGDITIVVGKDFTA